MKPTMLIASIALAASGASAACSSNKPAEDATSATGPVAATTGPSDLYQPNSPGTAAPASGEPVEATPARSPTSASPSTPTPSTSTPSTSTPSTSTPSTPPPSTPPTGARSNGATPSSPGAPPRPPVAASGEPDNTRVNTRDRSPNAPTPMDQSNAPADLQITQQIRQAVMADGSLSFTAKNVKIITANGKVTLRGPVNTEQERRSIEASARKIAGDGNVDDQIEVKK